MLYPRFVIVLLCCSIVKTHLTSMIHYDYQVSSLYYLLFSMFKGVECQLCLLLLLGEVMVWDQYYLVTRHGPSLTAHLSHQTGEPRTSGLH